MNSNTGPTSVSQGHGGEDDHGRSECQTARSSCEDVHNYRSNSNRSSCDGGGGGRRHQKKPKADLVLHIHQHHHHQDGVRPRSPQFFRRHTRNSDRRKHLLQHHCKVTALTEPGCDQHPRQHNPQQETPHTHTQTHREEETQTRRPDDQITSSSNNIASQEWLQLASRNELIAYIRSLERSLRVQRDAMSTPSPSNALQQSAESGTFSQMDTGKLVTLPRRSSPRRWSSDPQNNGQQPHHNNPEGSIFVFQPWQHNGQGDSNEPNDEPTSPRPIPAPRKRPTPVPRKGRRSSSVADAEGEAVATNGHVHDHHPVDSVGGTETLTALPSTTSAVCKLSSAQRVNPRLISFYSKPRRESSDAASKQQQQQQLYQEVSVEEESNETKDDAPPRPVITDAGNGEEQCEDGGDANDDNDGGSTTSDQEWLQSLLEFSEPSNDVMSNLSLKPSARSSAGDMVHHTDRREQKDAFEGERCEKAALVIQQHWKTYILNKKLAQLQSKALQKSIKRRLSRRSLPSLSASSAQAFDQQSQQRRVNSVTSIVSGVSDVTSDAECAFSCDSRRASSVSLQTAKACHQAGNLLASSTDSTQTLHGSVRPMSQPSQSEGPPVARPRRKSKAQLSAMPTHVEVDEETCTHQKGDEERHPHHKNQHQRRDELILLQATKAVFAADTEAFQHSTFPWMAVQAEAYSSEQLQRLARLCVIHFNHDAKAGAKWILDHHLVNTPQQFALFLKTERAINKRRVGECLGETKPFFLGVLDEFCSTFHLSGVPFDVSLRLFLRSCHLPGEAQKIERILECFAGQYHACNPDVFSCCDTPFILSFSLVMLNTDIHNSANKRKMTKEQFIRNNRGIDDGNDLDPAFLSDTYDRILREEFTTDADNSSMVEKIAQQLNGKYVQELVVPHRQFIARCDITVVEHGRSHAKQKSREAILFNDILMVVKPQKSKFNVKNIVPLAHLRIAFMDSVNFDGGIHLVNREDNDSIALSFRVDNIETSTMAKNFAQEVLEMVWINEALDTQHFMQLLHDGPDSLVLAYTPDALIPLESVVSEEGDHGSTVSTESSASTAAGKRFGLNLKKRRVSRAFFKKWTDASTSSPQSSATTLPSLLKKPSGLRLERASRHNSSQHLELLPQPVSSSRSPSSVAMTGSTAHEVAISDEVRQQHQRLGDELVVLQRPPRSPLSHLHGTVAAVCKGREDTGMDALPRKSTDVQVKLAQLDTDSASSSSSFKPIINQNNTQNSEA